MRIIRFPVALRFLATVFAVMGTVALVADATPALNGAGPFHATTFVEHWQAIAPATLKSARVAVSSATAPWVWDAAMAGPALTPTSVGFGALAFLAGYFGRRRKAVDVFAN